MTSPFPSRWTATAMPDQQGRVVLITGANSGLGLESARALVAAGATVLLACRSLAKADAARRELLVAAGGGALDVLELDLADLHSVVAAARQVQERYGRLDLLLANAGVMAPPRMRTRQGFELQFGVNHVGHSLLTRLLLPLLQAQPGARVVHVTSGAQYFGKLNFDDLNGERRYDRWAAYGQSKLANVALALELQRRLQHNRQWGVVAGGPPWPGAHQPPTRLGGGQWRPPRGRGLPADGSALPERRHGCVAPAVRRHGSAGRARRPLRPQPLRRPQRLARPSPRGSCSPGSRAGCPPLGGERAALPPGAARAGAAGALRLLRPNRRP